MKTLKKSENYRKEAEHISMFLFGEITINLIDRDDEYYEGYVKRMRKKYDLC